MVETCTDSRVTPDRPGRERKEACIAAIPHKCSPALLVSVADKVPNAGAILRDYRERGEGLRRRQGHWRRRWGMPRGPRAAAEAIPQRTVGNGEWHSRE